MPTPNAYEICLHIALNEALKVLRDVEKLGGMMVSMAFEVHSTENARKNIQDIIEAIGHEMHKEST